MLAGPKPRIVTFFSAATSAEKNATLVNLGASLAGAVSDVLLLDAKPACNGIATRLRAGRGITLFDAVREGQSLEQAVQMTEQGFSVASIGRVTRTLSRTKHAELEADGISESLCEAFHVLTRAMDVVLVDAEMEEQESLPMKTIASGEIVVQITPNADSIKTGYSMIKQLNSMLGRRSFGVLVTGASEKEAQKVFANMAQAASRYLAVPLTSLGSVPPDEHLARAARLGRTVVDAFPMANASAAFRSLAGRFVGTGLGVGA